MYILSEKISTILLCLEYLYLWICVAGSIMKTGAGCVFVYFLVCIPLLINLYNLLFCNVILCFFLFSFIAPWFSGLDIFLLFLVGSKIEEELSFLFLREIVWTGSMCLPIIYKAPGPWIWVLTPSFTSTQFHWMDWYGLSFIYFLFWNGLHRISFSISRFYNSNQLFIYYLMIANTINISFEVICTCSFTLTIWIYLC